MRRQREHRPGGVVARRRARRPGRDERARVRQDARVALPALAKAGESFDLVYLDPPYESDLYEPLLLECGGTLLSAGGLVVAEHFHKRALPETIGPLRTVRDVRVGDHRLSFYKRDE